MIFIEFNFTFVFLTVTKDDFNKSYPNNPVNLFTQSDRCNNPQPRYKKHSNFKAADAKYKYLLYKQCLPGCVVLNKTPHNVTTEIWAEGELKEELELITDHSQCEAYDSPRMKSTNEVGKSSKRSMVHSETLFNPSKEFSILSLLFK